MAQADIAQADIAQADIEKLRRLIARLRSDEGCPWDREQTLVDLRAYLLEEAHEAAAAIDGGDRRHLCEELGDLIFQAVFVARLAEEEGAFHLGEAIDVVHAKMIERHPHVFGNERLEDAAAVHRAWERRKLLEDGASRHRRLLEGMPPSLPALTAGLRMTQKAAGVGFDWTAPGEVLDKVREELAEIAEVLEAPGGGAQRRRQEEIGDLLFAIVNLSRHLGIDPEAAMAGANGKFRRRFEVVEEAFADRRGGLAEATMQEMEGAWEKAKRAERTP